MKSTNSSPPKRAAILGPEDAGDALGRLCEHRVTGGMAERVVDAFEAIQIDVEQGQLRPDGAAAVHRLVEHLHEGIAVVEPGELIVVGQLAATSCHRAGRCSWDRRRRRGSSPRARPAASRA
jgi:hypothetical protein